MRKRNIVAMIALSIVTFGIYGIYWSVTTKDEMNKLGAQIPTAWLVIVPFVNIWWMWKHAEGVELVTKGQMTGVMAFILMFLLGFIGYAIIQDTFNRMDAGTSQPVPPTPVAAA